MLKCVAISGEGIFNIPDNLFNFAKDHISNLQVGVNNIIPLNGYGGINAITVTLSLLHGVCKRCGFDDLYPNINDKCSRHSYTKKYTEIFAWSSYDGFMINQKSLESAFEEFLIDFSTKSKESDNGEWVWDYEKQDYKLI